ncbi:target of Nesh-SH3 isoform X2 [Betta splendens]|uniref:Target of Nesh-SH3 isoform X2 n=1 Tax=Betta splendens TaxID=158456 RepID=A0A6P7LEF3_BETSP|nr:target of Nesh-SH3 isoform X2 [Betta splendens]
MTRMQQPLHRPQVLLLALFIAGTVLSGPSTHSRSRVRRQNMKVRISATEDTIVMKFVRPNVDTKLEGYILGYGSTMFSKQFIQLPENGQPYETEFDAEPKYLIAVQPTATNEVKKQCTGKVELEKPLHLVIGSVTPTSVLLSWGTLLKTPYEGNIMDDCTEDGHYMVRYRERNRKWNYQTCPTSETVIDHLKPNAVYEFGVQPSSKDGTGTWSKPIVHRSNSEGVQVKVIRKIPERPSNTWKPPNTGSTVGSSPLGVPQVLKNKTLPVPQNIASVTKRLPTTTTTTLAPTTTTTTQKSLSTPGTTLPVPVVTKQPNGGEDLSRPVLIHSPLVPLVSELLPTTLHITATTTSLPLPHIDVDKPGAHPNSHNKEKPLVQDLPKAQVQDYYQPSEQPKPQPQPGSQSPPQTQAPLELSSQVSPQTLPQHITHRQLQPKLQTTTPIHSKLEVSSRSQIKHQVHHQTQPQQKTQSKMLVQSTPKTTAHAQTPQPTLQHISHTPPRTHSYTELQPQSPTESTNHPQTTRQPQVAITQEPQLTIQSQSSAQLKTVFFQTTTLPQPKDQSKPQTPALPKKPEPRTWNRQQPPNGRRRPHTKKPASHSQLIVQPRTPTQFLPEPLPKPHPASSPQPQPELQFQSQTRTYSEHNKITPRQTGSTAPSPPEESNPLPRPALATQKSGRYNHGPGMLRSPVAKVPPGRNITLHRTRVYPFVNRGGRPFYNSSTPGAVNGVRHRGNAHHKPLVQHKVKPGVRPSAPVNKKPNMVEKPRDQDKPMDPKQGHKESILKPFPPVTAKPRQEQPPHRQTTTSAPAVNSSHFDVYENSSIFSPLPASDVDIMGKKRFVAPHVVYKTDKKPEEPCSITSSLTFFPEEEGGDQNVTAPPRLPPSNVTVVTVEGCSSFVILDWEKSDNETREYEVVSTTEGPNGHEVSILTTNQTHTAVENLKPESSYEFTVTPKNELGTGPSSDPVSFSTESADPRVTEYVSGKDAIWTQFPFKADAYSECNGRQFVKRTWYRKFVGIQLCNSLRYKIYLSDSLNGKFYNIGDQTGHGEDHCQFVDSFLDGRTGTQMLADQLQSRPGFFRALRQEPVHFGEIGGKSHITYVGWYECGTPIPGKW